MRWFLLWCCLVWWYWFVWVLLILCGWLFGMVVMFCIVDGDVLDCGYLVVSFLRLFIVMIWLVWLILIEIFWLFMIRLLMCIVFMGVLVVGLICIWLLGMLGVSFSMVCNVIMDVVVDYVCGWYDVGYGWGVVLGLVG